VRLRNRLAKLEHQTTAVGQRKQLREANVFERMERWEAYRRGEGPKPEPLPCPPWIDPVKWDSRQRRADYLATGEPPPALTDEEQAYVDGLLQGLDEWATSLQESHRETTHPLAASGM
jgi:hypothetical protein